MHDHPPKRQWATVNRDCEATPAHTTDTHSPVRLIANTMVEVLATELRRCEERGEIEMARIQLVIHNELRMLLIEVIDLSPFGRR